MKQYFNLQGQVAVVTGASTGLGLQMAKALANQGANLVLLARRMNLLEANAESISREYGVEVLPLQCDITVTEQVKAAVAATMERFGKIAIRKHAALKASMLQDLEKGKLTEVDAINGAVSAFGRKVGCPTPMNDRVVDIIHRIERGELSPSFDNLKYFE